MLGFALPSTITVEGKAVPINTTHFCHIRIASALDDPRINEQQLMAMVVANCFGSLDHDPATLAALFAAAMAFHMRMDSVDDFARLKHKRKSKYGRVFAWSDDGARVSSDFQRFYHLDINSAAEPIHWWRFMALFDGLPSDSQTMMAAGIRAADPSELKNKDERKRLREKKRAVALSPRTEEEAMASL